MFWYLNIDQLIIFVDATIVQFFLSRFQTACCSYYFFDNLYSYIVIFLILPKLFLVSFSDLIFKIEYSCLVFSNSCKDVLNSPFITSICFSFSLKSKWAFNSLSSVAFKIFVKFCKYLILPFLFLSSLSKITFDSLASFLVFCNSSKVEFNFASREIILFSLVFNSLFVIFKLSFAVFKLLFISIINILYYLNYFLVQFQS